MWNSKWKIKKGEQFVECEVVIKRSDDKHIPAILNASRFDRNGKFVGIVEDLKDITDRKLAEQEIKNLHRYNRGLIEASLDPLMTFDQNGIIQDVNRVFLDECGMRKNDVLGEKCSKIRMLSGTPCELGSQYCPLEMARRTGQRVEITRDHEQKGVKYGELSRIMYPVTVEGRPRLFIEISRDITEYRNLIKELRSSEKKFRTILDTATDAIISIDSNHDSSCHYPKMNSFSSSTSLNIIKITC